MEQVTKFEYLGKYLSRMDEERKQRQFFEARPDGGRPRGRPRVTYEE